MRINQILAVLKQAPYFTKQNLGLALKKEGDDLDYWVKKLIKEKLIIPLKKGLYLSRYFQDIFLSNPQTSALYWVYAANILRQPSYVSLEYVLSETGLIPEAAFVLTSVTLKSSRKYKAGPRIFIYQNIKKDLYYGYQLKVLGSSGQVVRIAGPGKALFDYLYLKKFVRPKEMKEYLLKSGRINWKALSSSEKLKFKQLINKSNSKKMIAVKKILAKEKIL